MKFFHTSDWHLGKLVQSIYMTNDQQYILDLFIKAIEEEKPDAVVIAGDLYDRAVPPTEAIKLLNEFLEKIILTYKTPVLAIAGNHDSPSRLQFASNIMKANGCHIIGEISKQIEPIILKDSYGEVHFHLVPYADPSIVRTIFEEDEIRTHNDAMRKITEEITANMAPNARHVFVGHAFVTPHGEQQDNTSDSERPLAIGGTEQVDANHFLKFHYTALGHLHQAHFVLNESIQYAGSPLKYSISEERHKKGFHIVEMDAEGKITVEKRLLLPLHDVRTVEASMEELLKHETNYDYVFVRLLDEAPILSPMEKVRSVYPNAMNVIRATKQITANGQADPRTTRHKMDDLSLFRSFYQEVKGTPVSEETEAIFSEVLQELLHEKEEYKQAAKEIAVGK